METEPVTSLGDLMLQTEKTELIDTFIILGIFFKYSFFLKCLANLRDKEMKTIY